MKIKEKGWMQADSMTKSSATDKIIYRFYLTHKKRSLHVHNRAYL